MPELWYVVDRDPAAEYYIVGEDGAVCPVLVLVEARAWKADNSLADIPEDVHERLLELGCIQQEAGVYILKQDELDVIEAISRMGYDIQQNEEFASSYFETIKDDNSLLELALFFGTDLEMPV